MNIENKEQLIRIVSQVGNGAHVFAPKEWVNEEVLIVRLGKKTVKEKIFEKIYPHLDKIIAVLLYGSNVRAEATESSDLDVLIIAKEKFKLEKQEKQDFIVLTEKDLPEAIKINPILMYSIFKEAKAIINQDYLEKLKKIKVNPGYFREFILQTKNSIKSSREIIELDKKTGKYSSDSIIYSAILRLRGTFIINCFLKNLEFSNNNFKTWLSPIKVDYSGAYKIYSEVRAGNSGKTTKILIEQEEMLINFLEQEIIKLEKRLK